MRAVYTPALLLAAALCAAVAALPVGAFAGPPQGHLFIIGGGKRTPEMLRRFVELAGGPRARILVLPMASAIPDTVGAEQAAQFREAGAAHAAYLLVDRAAASADSTRARLAGVTGIFFSGGDQSRLTAALGGTPFLEHLRALYRDGGVVGGTSAGAAVMSSMMITGSEERNRDSANAFVSIRRGNIGTSAGFGFIDDAIVDQHFIRRKRHNRLLSLVLEHPRLLGIGIDEATAIVVNPDRTLDVLGEGTVIVFDASHAQGIATDKNGNLSGTGMITHILASGDVFDLNTRQPVTRGGQHGH